jgi:hypothetical protein
MINTSCSLKQYLSILIIYAVVSCDAGRNTQSGTIKQFNLDTKLVESRNPVNGSLSKDRRYTNSIEEHRNSSNIGPAEPADIVEVGREGECSGLIRHVENAGFSVRVVMCNSAIKTFTFKHPVVDIKTNPSYPYIAVYTTSLYDHVPEKGAEDALPDALFIIDAEKNRKYHYKEAWSPRYNYEIWSPKGTYAAFLCSDEGPIDIIKSKKLAEYLNRRFQVYRKVSANKHPSIQNPAQEHRVIGWSSDTTLLFRHGCFDEDWKTEYNLTSDTYRRLGTAFDSSISAKFDNLDLTITTIQNDIVIENGVLTRYEVSRRLRWYFELITNKCITPIKDKYKEILTGEFSLRFKLNMEGQVAEPIISSLQISNLLSDKTAFSNCLIESTEKMSFADADKSGTERVTIRIAINKSHDMTIHDN